MESKYKNGKIYKITDNAYTKCYYGSSISTLPQRWHKHKTSYKRYLNNEDKRYMTSFIIFEEFGIENCKIELVELFQCDSKIELEKKEGEYIKNNECVNKIIAGRTQKEYREDNKEQLKEYSKKYREENKEKLKEQKKEYQEKNKEIIKEKKKEYSIKRKKELSEYHRKYYQENKEKIIANVTIYKENNKDDLKKKRKLRIQQEKII